MTVKLKAIVESFRNEPSLEYIKQEDSKLFFRLNGTLEDITIRVLELPNGRYALNIKTYLIAPKFHLKRRLHNLKKTELIFELEQIINTYIDDYSALIRDIHPSDIKLEVY